MDNKRSSCLLFTFFPLYFGLADEDEHLMRANHWLKLRRPIKYLTEIRTDTGLKQTTWNRLIIYL